MEEGRAFEEDEAWHILQIGSNSDTEQLLEQVRGAEWQIATAKN